MRKLHRKASATLGALLTVCLWGTQAGAQDAVAEKAQRCATRLSIAFKGISPDAALRSSPNPQSSIDAMMATPEFRERFARFVNSKFNDVPGNTPEEDAAYWLSREVLTRNLPWKDLFTGQFRVDRQNNATVVVADPNGLGFFRSPAWLRRYAGNEPNGVKIVTAYRIMNNAIGLKLTAATTSPDQDITATGRQAPGCAPCHYDSAFALDKVARILTTRVGTGDQMTFAPPNQGPQQILGGITIANDGELVNALVNSDSFGFNTCRMAFMYLHGRPEYTCEGPVFDRCMAAFKVDGRVQSALKAVAEDAGFCQ